VFVFLHRKALPAPLRHATLKDRDILIAQFCCRSRGGIAERSAYAAAIKYDLGTPIFWKQVPVSPHPISGDIDGSGDMGSLILLRHANINKRDMFRLFHQVLQLFGTNDRVLRQSGGSKKKC
jgi:hypothetical protein